MDRLTIKATKDKDGKIVKVEKLMEPVVGDVEITVTAQEDADRIAELDAKEARRQAYIKQGWVKPFDLIDDLIDAIAKNEVAQLKAVRDKIKQDN